MASRARPPATGWTGLPPRAETGVAVGLAAAAVGAAVFVATRAAGTLRLPIAYQALVFGAFLGAYLSMPGGFEANFSTPTPAKKMSVSDVVYYTMVVHTTAGFGEIYPTTLYARSVVAAHLGAVFLGVAGLVPFLSAS